MNVPAAAVGRAPGVTTLPTLSHLSQNGAFDAALIPSIHDIFHFDTNQFLVPNDGECSPIDYDDLFSLLNEPAGQASEKSSGSKVHVASPGSSAWTQASAPLSQLTPTLQVLGADVPLQQQQQESAHGAQPKRSEAKAPKDVPLKRIRSVSNNKNKKQNQLKELEALAAQKVEDLHRLMRENSELKFRKDLLEKVVQMREHQLKVIRGDPDPRPQPLQSSCSSSGSCGPQALTNATCTGCAPPHGMSLAEQVRTFSCGCLMASGEVVMPPVDRERFRSMGKSQLMEGWKHFLAEVAVPLLALDGAPDDEVAAEAVRRLAGDATHLLKHASLLAPDTVMVASHTHLETEELSSPPPDHWRTVVSTVDLTHQQTSELVAVFGLFTSIMAGILAERRTLTQHMATGLHGPTADVTKALEQLTVSPECQVLQALQRSMRREKTAHLLLRGFLYGRCLSVVQFVKAALYSYPWMPDATAIVSTVTEIAGDGGGGGLVGGGTSS